MSEIKLESTELLNLKTAASRLEIHRQTLYRWIAIGKIQTITVASNQLIHVSEVERLTCQSSTPTQ